MARQALSAAVIRSVTMSGSPTPSTRRSTPFDPVVRAALEKYAASKDGLGS